ncbi:MAG: hypothetical protein IKD96_04885 [Oscillospiraceae bacterium]|nr:hypothetical protein [Oscillospiraceae bacterium]
MFRNGEKPIKNRRKLPLKALKGILWNSMKAKVLFLRKSEKTLKYQQKLKKYKGYVVYSKQGIDENVTLVL